MLHLLDPSAVPAGLALAESWGVPYVQDVPDFLPFGTGLRLSRRLCRALVVPGVDLAVDLTRSMGVPAGLVAVVVPGIEARRDRACDHEGRVPVVGAGGIHDHGSGLSEFVEATAAVREMVADVEFVIAVDGARRGELRRRAAHLGIADRFTFVAPTTSESTFWGVIDVFCEPSTGPDSGLTLAHALSRGVPSVASCVPGLRRWIDHRQTGLLVPPADRERLAQALIGLLQDREWARTLGQAARERMRDLCGPERQADELVDLYRRVFARRPAGLRLVRGPSSRGPGIGVS
jgi:glycosyltransferase involved in cell wall biosynthesis